MSIVIPSLGSMLLKYFLGRTGRALLSFRERDPIARGVQEALDRWQRSLPKGFDLYTQSLEQMLRDEDLVSPKRDEVVTLLQGGKLPEANLWFDALLEVWNAAVERLRAAGEDSQGFYARGQQEVVPHLSSLSQELERVFSTDPARALPAILARLPPPGNAASGLESVVWKSELEQLQRKTSQIRLVGLNLLVETERALPLYVSAASDSSSAIPGDEFEARYVADDEGSAALLLGAPGIGKSTALRMVAAHLLAKGHKVVFGSLARATRALASGEPFEFAIADGLFDGRYDRETRVALLREADAVIVDGLDELRGARGVAVEQLQQWAEHDDRRRIVVASRPSSDLAALMPAYTRFVLSAPKERDVARFIDRVAEAVGSGELNGSARQRIASIADRQGDVATPLLLSFVLALELSGDGQVIPNRVRLYERVLGLIARSVRVDRPYLVEMSEREAHLVLDVLAWTHRLNPTLDLDAISREAVNVLVSSHPQLANPETTVERAIAFWHERGLLDLVPNVLRDDIDFVHATIEEFAAGRHLARQLTRDKASAALRDCIRTEDEQVLAVAAVSGNSRAVVTELLATSSDPERTLLCARVVLDAELDEQAKEQLLKALVQLIREGTIQTHVADAGMAIMSLILAGRLEPDRVGSHVGDHRDHAEIARRLALLAVRSACVAAGVGSSDELTAWLRDEFQREDTEDAFDFSDGFRPWTYLNRLIPDVVRTVTEQQGDVAGARLVTDVFRAKRASLSTFQQLSSWAYREQREGVTKALQSVSSSWMGNSDEFRDDWARDQEADLGFLAAVDLACDQEPSAPRGDGSDLATLLRSTNLLEVAAVDFRATFSSAKLRDELAGLLKAWRFALGLPAARLRADVEQRRHAVANDRFGYVLFQLPAVPNRRRVWDRVDFGDPMLSPSRLVAWMKVRLSTPFVLALPILENHPDRGRVVAELTRLVEDRHPHVLARLSMIGEPLRDRPWLDRVQGVLEGQWGPGGHYLLGLLEEGALMLPAIQHRIAEALLEPDVQVVKSAAENLLRMSEIPIALVAAATKAFELWTQNPPSEVRRISRRGVEVREIPPTPRPELLRVLLATGSCDPKPFLRDSDDGVSRIAFAYIREAADSPACFDALLSPGVDAANLIAGFRSTPLLGAHEIEWIVRTALRLDQPDQTRVALIKVLAQAESMPAGLATETLRTLCADPSPLIRDRALAALRSRAPHV